MASSLVVVVKVVVVTVVEVLVTEVVVSSGISATFTQGVAKVAVSIHVLCQRCSLSDWLTSPPVSINLKPFLNSPSKVNPPQCSLFLRPQKELFIVF